LPVGNSDRGVGLWAGQVMFGLDNSNQHIDWWHEAIPGSGEGFDHEGTLTSIVLNPSLTIGLSNYWNTTINKTLGRKTMTWTGDTTTIHHRDEGTETDFINAIGGYLGDTKLMLRYLVFNDGQGPGKRLFFGGGIIVPSKNTLSSDPFFLNDKGAEIDHRHFAISEGVYKGCIEIQFFKKKIKNPVFMGGTIYVEKAFAENDYGFKASDIYDLSLTAFSKKIPVINGSMGTNFITRHTTSAYWNGFEAPNSRATVLTVGFGGLWNLDIGGIGVNIQKPFFIEGVFSGIEGELDQQVGVWQVSFNYRRLLDFAIPWLDPLK